MRPSRILALLECEFLATRGGAHTPVMLWGPPGAGKSQLVAQAAARHGAPVIDVRLAQMEPTDLRGIPFRDGRNVVWGATPPCQFPKSDEALIAPGRDHRSLFCR